VAEKEYQRLTRSAVGGRGRITLTFTSRQSLWLAKDHLLSIRSNRFIEEYRRFYFRDIQAITLRRTRRRAIWNLALSLALLVVLASFLSDSRPVLSANLWPWYLLFAILSLPLLINNVRGPTCTCYIRTAVQMEELPSMNRVRKVSRILERIRPLIAEAQGELTAEQLSDGMQELARAAAATEAERRFVTSPLNLS
jgi:hypothetical protein